MDNLPNPEELRKKYPSNDGSEKPKVAKVASGKVVSRGSGIKKLIRDVIIFGDLKETIKYTIVNEVVPKGIDLIASSLHSFIDTLFNGEYEDDRDQGSRTRNAYIPYRNYSEKKTRTRVKPRTRFELDDVAFSTIKEAKDVLAFLEDNINEFGAASVSDFYTCVGISTDYASRNFGWSDLSKACIRTCREGYYIDFPIIERLD